MKNFTLFSNGEIYAESDTWISSDLLPVDTYIRQQLVYSTKWYRVVAIKGYHEVELINPSTLPKWVHAWELIL